MLSLLLISLQRYQIISFDVANKFQTLFQICRAMILLDFTFLLNGLSHSICLHPWIILFLGPLSLVAHLFLHLSVMSANVWWESKTTVKEKKQLTIGYVRDGLHR